MVVKWLRAARLNLNTEAEYIAQYDPDAAQKVYAYIRTRVAALAEQPESGRPGRVLGTRELVIERYPYLVPYRVVDGEVQILRVFHTSRKPPEEW